LAVLLYEGEHRPAARTETPIGFASVIVAEIKRHQPTIYDAAPRFLAAACESQTAVDVASKGVTPKPCVRVCATSTINGRTAIMAIPPTDHGQDCPCVISRDVTPRPSRKVCAASTTDGLASRWKYIRQTTDSATVDAAARPSSTSARKHNGDTPNRSDDHMYNRKMRGQGLRKRLGLTRSCVEGLAASLDHLRLWCERGGPATVPPGNYYRRAARELNQLGAGVCRPLSLAVGSTVRVRQTHGLP
jgi:hypothetical protein